jgi:DNA polymerase III gamma/tau subunit
VQSRCQVFEFKKPTREILAKMTAAIAKKEGYTLVPDAADLIAMLAEGSYRDALSVLQKVFSAAEGKTLVREVVEQTTGAPKREQVHTLIAALAAGKCGAGLASIEQAAKSGADMKLFLELVLESIRATLLLRYAPELRTSLGSELGVDEFSVLQKFASEKGITHTTMLAFLTAADRIRYAPIPALPIELAVLELFSEDSGS